MFHPTETALGRLSLKVVFVVLLGVALNYWGIASNAFVVQMNNGAMPVLLNDDGLLVTMITEDHEMTRHIARDGNFMLLADRFRIEFPSIKDRIPGGMLGNAIHWWANYLLYPIEYGVYFVSIGDLMRWLGSALFLVATPVLVLLIPFQAYASRRAQIPKKEIQIIQI